LDDLGESTSTLLLDEESEEEKVNLKVFISQKEIKRTKRFKKQHQERGRTLVSIDQLYKKIYRATQIQAYVETSLIQEHFDEKNAASFQSRPTVNDM
jgi:uridine kinase